jgi:hypothetical protein
MPDKNVQLPDGRIVAFPDSMADADISAVIKKQLGAPKTERAMQQTMGGPPMFTDVPAGEGAKFEAAGKAGYAEGGKTGLEMVGGTIGGEVASGMRGIVGVLARMLGAGVGGAAGNVAGQAAGTGKVNPSEILPAGAGMAAGQGVGEAFGAGLPALRSALSRMMYTGEVAADGTAELSKVGRSILHPTQLPENVLRATVPPPPEAAAAAAKQAGETNAAKLESQMKETEAARQQAITDKAKLEMQDATEQAAAVKRQQAAARLAAKNTPQPSPFEGMTSSAKATFSDLKLPPAGDIPKSSPQLFAQGGGFQAPEPSKIQTALSPPPPINRTLVSYDRDLLVHMARGGDLNALRELIRNPGGIDVASAVPNSKYLLESGRPTVIYGGPKD